MNRLTLGFCVVKRLHSNSFDAFLTSVFNLLCTFFITITYHFMFFLLFALKKTV